MTATAMLHRTRAIHRRLKEGEDAAPLLDQVVQLGHLTRAARDHRLLPSWRHFELPNQAAHIGMKLTSLLRTLSPTQVQAARGNSQQANDRCKSKCYRRLALTMTMLRTSVIHLQDGTPLLDPL